LGRRRSHWPRSVNPRAVTEPTRIRFSIAVPVTCDILVRLPEGLRVIALIRVVGLKDKTNAAAIIAALRTRDPEATIKIDHQRGLIDVTSEASVPELCAVLHDTGFIAAPIKSTPGEWSANDTLRLLLRTILFAGLGAFGGTVVGVGVGILNLTLNSDAHPVGMRALAQWAFH